MGLMRFCVTPPDRISDDALRSVYMSGIDRVAWRAEVRFEAGQLTVRRAVSESGNLNILWPVGRHGCLTLSTGCLPEQPDPYHLPLELARGTVGQLTQQMAQWREAGLSVPTNVAEAVQNAVRCFGQAAVDQADRAQSAEKAEQAIAIALDAADLLVAAYAEQSAASARHTHLLGANLGLASPDEAMTRQLVRCFNVATVPFCWRHAEPNQEELQWVTSDQQIDWCRAHSLTICGGPLLQFDPCGLPDWLYLYEDDFDNVFTFAAEYIRTVVARYRGKIDLWQCAGRVASSETLGLSEEEKLRLAATALSTVRSVDAATPLLLSFDQPWAEYLAHREIDLPPLYFADALIRAGVDVSGLVLDVDLGYRPGGTLPRTPLEFSRQLDHWSLLGLPLFVSITVPSAPEPDPVAQCQATLPPGPWTPESQAAWIARYVPLILAKPLVRGVFYNQLHDAWPHPFPHGGLFDAQGQAKPALETLAGIREQFRV